MAIQANGDLLLIGRGKVFFKRTEAAGTARGLKFVGDCPKLEIAMQQEVAVARSSVEAAGPVIKQVVVSNEPQIRMALRELDKDNLANLLGGTFSSYTQAATGITNEPYPDVRQGTYIKLAKRGPISAVTVEPLGGGTAFTVTTDYVIEDASIPLIYIVPGGGIADGADIQVDYTPTAITGAGLETVRGATTPVIEGSLLYVPDNASGPKWQLEVWKLSLKSEAILAMIHPPGTTEFAEAELVGTVLSDATAHPSEPYFLLTRLP